MNNSKLSNFSPKSLENTKKLQRGGITTPNNQNEQKMLELNREVLSMDKDGKQKSRAR